ncbi:MAG: metallophosphoesterase family protein [Candidatus Hydrogenedentes bacterium]|nr:metallophosphoesterase family protein [Candidatus Hydrogenedentota bacterium]
MKLLVVSDLHYALKQFDWLCARTSGHDLLVIAGDLLDLAGHADIDTQIIVVEKYLTRLAALAPVAVCSGNHDLDGENGAGERYAEWLRHVEIEGVSVDSQTLFHDSLTITICPWWDGENSRSQVQAHLERDAERRGSARWIWLYHAPPDGAKTSWNGKRFSGDAFLAEMIARLNPDIVLGGHIHNSPFSAAGSWYDRIENTWVFNPGREMSSTPTCMSIDFDTMQAVWESSSGRKQIRLASQEGVHSPAV